MLKRGDEILTIFAPIIFFFMLWATLFHLLPLRQISYGSREFAVVSCAYLFVYLMGYLLFLRKLHKSFMIPYLYGAIAFPIFAFMLDKLEKINRYPVILMFFVFNGAYTLIRTKLYKCFGFDEQDYQNQGNGGN